MKLYILIISIVLGACRGDEEQGEKINDRSIPAEKAIEVDMSEEKAEVGTSGENLKLVDIWAPYTSWYITAEEYRAMPEGKFWADTLSLPVPKMTSEERAKLTGGDFGNSFYSQKTFYQYMKRLEWAKYSKSSASLGLASPPPPQLADCLWNLASALTGPFANLLASYLPLTGAAAEFAAKTDLGNAVSSLTSMPSCVSQMKKCNKDCVEATRTCVISICSAIAAVFPPFGVICSSMSIAVVMQSCGAWLGYTGFNAVCPDIMDFLEGNNSGDCAGCKPSGASNSLTSCKLCCNRKAELPQNKKCCFQDYKSNCHTKCTQTCNKPGNGSYPPNTSCTTANPPACQGVSD